MSHLSMGLRWTRALHLDSHVAPHRAPLKNPVKGTLRSAPLKPRSGQTQVLETHVLAQSPAQENAMNFRLLCQNLGLAKPGFAGC